MIILSILITNLLLMIIISVLMNNDYYIYVNY